MSADEAMEVLELAMDDHYTAAELKDQYDDELVDQAYEARDRAEELANDYGEMAEALEKGARSVADYLMEHRSHMDEKALEISNAADEIEEDLEDIDEPNVDTGDLLARANSIETKVENEYDFNF